MKSLSLTYSTENKCQFIISDDPFLSWIGDFDSEKYKRFFVIIDKNVYRIWGKKITDQLKRHNKETFVFEVEPTEFSKSIEFYPVAVDYLEKYLCNRYDMVIAIGGGIILDLVSFLTSTYMRGLPFYAIPTTLIGQVDAITAGKTCLNSGNTKNLLGTFYYPLMVYNNIHILKTNSLYYSRQGLSEMFKYGLLASKELLSKLKIYKESSSDGDLIDSIELTMKARSVIRKKDPLASNLGHTFGHAIEKMSNYNILHGDAITVGTVLALNFAERIGLMKREVVADIIKEMKYLQLNVYLDKDIDADRLLNYMMHDKKASVDTLYLVLISDIERPYENEGMPFYSAQPGIVRDFLNSFLKNYKYSINNCAEFIKKDELYYNE